MPRAADAAVRTLREERPRFHGREEAGTKNFAIQFPMLQWIAANVPEGARTLEKGCGYSTAVLASLARDHTTISPFGEEHDAIRAWCASHGIHLESVRFIAAPSQDVVPGLDCGQLDFVLIDGDHAFPAPFIDWYYTADQIRVGGRVAVDDTQITTGKILRDFLRREAGRWELTQEIGKTAIFTRIASEPVARGVLWRQQPYCRSPLREFLARPLGRLRSR